MTAMSKLFSLSVLVVGLLAALLCSPPRPAESAPAGRTSDGSQMRVQFYVGSSQQPYGEVVIDRRNLSAGQKAAKDCIFWFQDDKTGRWIRAIVSMTLSPEQDKTP